MVDFYVYEILDQAGAVLYVGRSYDPRIRLRAFKRKHPELDVTQRVVFGPASLEEASAEELRRLRAAKPPLNKIVSSSRAATGCVKTAAQKLKIADALRGKPLSDAHKQKLWATRDREPLRTRNRDLEWTPELRSKVSAGVAKFFANPANREAHRKRCQETMDRLKAEGKPIGRAQHRNKKC